jgi:DNA processing protein
MVSNIKHTNSIFFKKPINALDEMAGYEALWTESKTSFKSLAEKFRNNPHLLPSDFYSKSDLKKISEEVIEKFQNANLFDYKFCLFQTIDYPQKLRDAENPIEFFYYRGNLDFAFSPKSIAVVGSRNASEDGIKRTKKLVKSLVENSFTIYSGLARGIDTAAHKTAIELGGKTVAVIGTPITEVYPKENSELQQHIANSHLLISQVPILRYLKQSIQGNRLFFPARNITMSALTDATVIVEASETSGTLIQARAALKQNRKLFILDNCFKNSNLTWPAKFAERGAIRVRNFDDINMAIRI